MERIPYLLSISHSSGMMNMLIDIQNIKRFSQVGDPNMQKSARNEFLPVQIKVMTYPFGNKSEYTSSTCGRTRMNAIIVFLSPRTSVHPVCLLNIHNVQMLL